MNRLSKLTRDVNTLYLAKNPNRAEWADWLFEHHIFVVAKKATELADRFGANKELCAAAALLHDIADAVMPREHNEHAAESAALARRLLQTDFTQEEITIIVDDAMTKHGCKEGRTPQTMEGKVMATADALAHLQTDFYSHAFNVFKEEGESFQEIRNWALAKIERDYRDKIFFEEVRYQVKEEYEKAKSLFLSC